MGFISGEEKSISKRNIVGFPDGSANGTVLSGGGGGATTAGKKVVFVNLATTSNITLSGLQTIDGIVTDSGWSVLVKNQTDASENGIYLTNSGAWVRQYTTIDILEQPILIVVFDGTANIQHLFERLSRDNTTLYADIGDVYPSSELPDGDDSNQILSWNDTTGVWEIPENVLLGDDSDGNGIVFVYNDDFPSTASPGYSFITSSGLTVYPYGTDSASTKYIKLLNNLLEIKDGINSAKIKGGAGGGLTVDGNQMILNKNYLQFRSGSDLKISLTSGSIPKLELFGGGGADVLVDEDSLSFSGQTSTETQKAIWDKDGKMVWVQSDFSKLSSDFILTSNTYPTTSSNFGLNLSFDTFEAIVKYRILVSYSTDADAAEGFAIKIANEDSTSTPLNFTIGENNIYKILQIGVAGSTTTNTTDVTEITNAPATAGTYVYEGEFKITSNSFTSTSDRINIFFRKIVGSNAVTVLAGSYVTIEHLNES